MLIRTITSNTEETLLHAIEEQGNSSVTKSFLQCVFSEFDVKAPSPDNLVLMLKNIIKDNNGAIYYCFDKDVIIEWVGSSQQIKTSIENEIIQFLKKQQPSFNPEGFCQYFDLSAHGEELRIICKHKIAKKNKGKSGDHAELQKSHPINQELKISNEQISIFNNAAKTKQNRKNPEILIVEDQAFSRTLLLSILTKEYKCHVAKNAAEAISLHINHAPDIILLDIELPDNNGHNVAKCIREIDKSVFIIMVTANNYENDVLKAKENKVQGFIIKPYNKQKILEIINNYKKIYNKG